MNNVLHEDQKNLVLSLLQDSAEKAIGSTFDSDLFVNHAKTQISAGLDIGEKDVDIQLKTQNEGVIRLTIGKDRAELNYTVAF